MKPRDTGQIGVATRQVTPSNLSERQLRELLTTLTKTPTDVVLQVGHVLRLGLAVVMVGLPVGGRIDGSESRGGGLASGSKTSRRAIRAAASSRSPAARGRSSLTMIEEKEQAVLTIAIATNHVTRIEESVGSGTAKGGGEAEKAKQTKHLQSWAAKAKRTVPLLLELLESGVSAMGVEHARLIRSHVDAIPAKKAARVSIS